MLKRIVIDMNCDLVFINGKYLDVETREFVLGNILIKYGKICGAFEILRCTDQPGGFQKRHA